MTNLIMDTGNIAELNNLGPDDEIANMDATVAPTEAPMEFHVQMRGHTFRDMEELIVNAAAQQIIGWHSDGNKLKKLIEERCVEQVTMQASAALAKVSVEIIDQPMTPKFPGSKDEPVTMREFIGLTGRAYLTEVVTRDGKPTSNGGWGSSEGKPRIQWIVGDHIERKFKDEIEKATNTAIAEIQIALKAKYDAFLAGEKKRLSEALAKLAA